MPRSTPPSYDRKIVAIDFDGTIAPWGPLFDQGPPHHGTAAAINALRAVGYRVIIWSSRFSTEWWDLEAKVRKVRAADFGEGQYRYVEDYLAKYGIEYDELESKPQARVYFDDRAWRTTSNTLAADLTTLLENGRMDADV